MAKLGLFKRKGGENGRKSAESAQTSAGNHLQPTTHYIYRYGIFIKRSALL